MKARNAASATAGKSSVQTRFEWVGFALGRAEAIRGGPLRPGSGGLAAMGGPVDPSPVPSVESRQRLLNFVRGYRISQAIYVATRLGIRDLLADGPREIDELAHATGSHLPSLRRVLLFLAGVGVLDKVGPDRFAL